MSIEAKPSEHQEKRKSIGTKRKDNKKSEPNKNLKVLVVGDSNLRNVKGEKLTNDYRDVEVRFK